MPELPHMQFLTDSVAARSEPPFVCSRTESGMDAAWVHVAGALDIATTPQLVETLDASMSDARLVVLDLRELTFMDCAGVHAIVDAGSRARRAGRQLLLLRGSASVDHLFALTGNAGRVDIADLGPVQPPVAALQRSLVSSSLLKSGDRPHGDGHSHRAS
jgi:anti-anti-sigma factor